MIIDITQDAGLEEKIEKAISYRDIPQLKITNSKKVLDTPNKSYCSHVCEALPLVGTNFKFKLGDHLLLGGEHTRKVSPGFYSPIVHNEDATSDEKKEIVKGSPSFGMFSLFKYHFNYFIY